MKLEALFFAIASVVNAQRFGYLNNAAQGDCLTVKEGETIAGQELVMERCQTTEGQLWLYNGPGQEAGTIRPMGDTRLCVTTASTSLGEAAVLIRCEDGLNQEFYFTESFMLELGTTGLSLTANEDVTVSLSTLDVNDNRQKWSISPIAPSEQDFFTMQSRYTKECVGYFGDATVRTSVVPVTCDGSTQQLWAYIPIIKSIVPYASRHDFSLCLSPNVRSFLHSELQPCSGFNSFTQWDIVGEMVLSYADPNKALTVHRSGRLPLLPKDPGFGIQEWIFNYAT